MNKELSELYSDITPDEITIVGISTSIGGLSLVQKINSLLKINLSLFKDFESYNKDTNTISLFKNYYYDNSQYRLKTFLFSNKNKENKILLDDKKLLKEKKAFDYIYILLGRDHMRHAENLIEHIREIPNISLVRRIYPPENTNKDDIIKERKEKVKTLSLFEEEKKTSVIKEKKRKKENLNISNILEDIEYNLGNIMFEKRSFLGFRIIINTKLLNEINTIISYFGLEDIRPFKLENYHLSLCFIGNTSKKQLKKIKVIVEEILEKEYKNDLEIIINGLDYIEQKDNTTELYLKFQNHPQLLDLNDKVKQALKNKNLYNLNRDFIPHITIANIKNLREKIKIEEIKEKFGKKSEKIKLSPVILFESISIDNSKRYDVLKIFN